MQSHLANASVIKQLLRDKNIRPSRKLGQNFLVDRNVVEKIVKASELKKSDTILEIGPGAGVLTAALAPHVKKVVAVELDPIMADIARDVTAHLPNVEIIHGDILSTDIARTLLANKKDSTYKVVANLPYQITSPIFRLLLENEPKPDAMYVTIQKEVAERIVAKPPDANLLGNMVQFYGKPEILFKIKPGSFWPEPDVDSSFIAIRIAGTGPAKRSDLLGKEKTKELFRTMKAGFSQKRKQLSNSLSAGLGIPKDAADEMLGKAEIDPQRRAETMTLDEWVNLIQ